MNSTCGVAARAESTEAARAPSVEGALRRDAPRRVARAEEQHVVHPVLVKSPSGSLVPFGLLRHAVELLTSSAIDGSGQKKGVSRSASKPRAVPFELAADRQEAHSSPR